MTWDEIIIVAASANGRCFRLFSLFSLSFLCAHRHRLRLRLRIFVHCKFCCVILIFERQRKRSRRGRGQQRGHGLRTEPGLLQVR